MALFNNETSDWLEGANPSPNYSNKRWINVPGESLPKQETAAPVAPAAVPEKSIDGAKISNMANAAANLVTSGQPVRGSFTAQPGQSVHGSRSMFNTPEESAAIARAEEEKARVARVNAYIAKNAAATTVPGIAGVPQTVAPYDKLTDNQKKTFATLIAQGPKSGVMSPEDYARKWALENAGIDTDTIKGELKNFFDKDGNMLTDQAKIASLEGRDSSWYQAKGREEQAAAARAGGWLAPLETGGGRYVTAESRKARNESLSAMASLPKNYEDSQRKADKDVIDAYYKRTDVTGERAAALEKLDKEQKYVNDRLDKELWQRAREHEGDLSFKRLEAQMQNQIATAKNDIERDRVIKEHEDRVQARVLAWDSLTANIMNDEKLSKQQAKAKLKEIKAYADGQVRVAEAGHTPEERAKNWSEAVANISKSIIGDYDVNKHGTDKAKYDQRLTASVNEAMKALALAFPPEANAKIARVPGSNKMQIVYDGGAGQAVAVEIDADQVLSLRAQAAKAAAEANANQNKTK